MVVKKSNKNQYGNMNAIIHLEIPLEQEVGIGAIEFIDKNSLDKDDRKLLFTMLGYIPYEGGDSNSGKISRKKREPLWRVHETLARIRAERIEDRLKAEQMFG